MSAAFIKLSATKIDTLRDRINNDPDNLAEYDCILTDCMVVIDDSEIDLTTLIPNLPMLLTINNEILYLMPQVVYAIGPGWSSIIESSQESTGIGTKSVYWKFKLVRPAST